MSHRTLTSCGIGLLLGCGLVASGCTRPIGTVVDALDAVPAHDAGPDADASLCPEPPDIECTRRENGPCSRWVTASPECSETGQWQCPPDALVYAGEGIPGQSCLPFHGIDSLFVRVASTGIPVERGDGRCMWIMWDGTTRDGTTVAHPAAVLPDRPLNGTCLEEASIVGGDQPVSVADPSTLGFDAIVSLGDSLRWNGRSWVYYRHWVYDAGQPFGVRLMGTRLGWYDHENESLELLPGFMWSYDHAFGDAAVVVDGRPHVYGCHGPPDSFSYHCYLARVSSGSIEDIAGYEFFSGREGWSPDQADEASVFVSGPHRAAVRFHPGLGKYLLVFIYGFGTSLQLSTASAPEGPWTTPVAFAECELPADDPDAFCATPALHLELMSDRRPNELVVTYDIGTLAPDWAERQQANPAAFWPRLVRVELPRWLLVFEEFFQAAGGP